MLLGAAAYLARHKPFKGTVYFNFPGMPRGHFGIRRR
ncbi:hypothetical protein [Acidovorax sp. sif1233]